MNLRKISMVVILVGVILFFAPQKVTVNMGDEQVIAWEGGGVQWG